MKTFILSIFLVVSTASFSQKSLTGLWTGTLTNDSTTIRSDQSFEIALTQYKEKVYGYSRTTFIVRDTLYYMVKRVKGTVDGDVCEVKDDEIIANNFRGHVDKGVKVTMIFRMNKQDTTWHLEGDWKTNKTKNFYSISGKAALKEETDLEKSKIFPHLEELNVAKDVPFYAETKKPVLSPAPPVVKPAPPVTKTKDVATIEKPKETKADKKADKEDKKKTEVPVVAPPPVASNETKKTDPVKTPELTKQEVEVTPSVIKTPKAAEFVAERKTMPPQEVKFKADSLELVLYDNGEVDGDTVSVLMNGNIIMEKQGLKASAIKKMIYLKPGENEFTLVLYAENLGKYPPNTGLLVIHDGEETYQLRFSADLQQNAAIIFRRNPK